MVDTVGSRGSYFFALSLAITFVYAIVIASKVTPDWMVIIGNFIGEYHITVGIQNVIGYPIGTAEQAEAVIQSIVPIVAVG